MTIRAATLSDIQHIQALHHAGDAYHAELLPRFIQRVDGDPRPHDYITRRIEDDDSDYILAERDGDIVGMILIQKSATSPYPMIRAYDYAMINEAIVAEAHRGQGIGTALLEAARRWAQGRGLHRLQLVVWHDNTLAREFYLRHGFQPLNMRMELDMESL